MKTNQEYKAEEGGSLACLECQDEFGTNFGEISCPSCYEWHCWEERKRFFEVLDDAIAAWFGDRCLPAQQAMERIAKAREEAGHSIGVDLREEPLRGDPKIALDAAIKRQKTLFEALERRNRRINEKAKA